MGENARWPLPWFLKYYLSLQEWALPTSVTYAVSTNLIVSDWHMINGCTHYVNLVEPIMMASNHHEAGSLKQVVVKNIMWNSMECVMSASSSGLPRTLCRWVQWNLRFLEVVRHLHAMDHDTMFRWTCDRLVLPSIRLKRHRDWFIYRLKLWGNIPLQHWKN